MLYFRDCRAKFSANLDSNGKKYKPHQQTPLWPAIISLFGESICSRGPRAPKFRLEDLARIMTWCEVRGLLPVCRLLPANSLNHTPKSCRREGLFSFSWIFVSGGRSSASGSDLGRSTPEGQSSDELRFFLSHFLPRRTSSKRIGPRAVPRSFCGDAPLANTIRSSATDGAASRRTMSITTGLASGAVAAPVVGKPSPSCRYFLFLTRTTVC